MVIASLFNVISAFYSRVLKITKIELWQHYSILVRVFVVMSGVLPWNIVVSVRIKIELSACVFACAPTSFFFFFLAFLITTKPV